MNIIYFTRTGSGGGKGWAQEKGAETAGIAGVIRITRAHYAARASATDWIFAWKVIEILVTCTPREESFSVQCDWLKLIESRGRGRAFVSRRISRRETF